MFRTDVNKIIGGGGGRVNEMVKNLSKSKKLKNKKSEILTRLSNIKAIEKPMFLTLNGRKAFNYLRQTFIKALILQHFDLECHIMIKTNISGFPICRVFGSLRTFLITSNKSNLANKFDFD